MTASFNKLADKVLETLETAVPGAGEKLNNVAVLANTYMPLISFLPK